MRYLNNFWVRFIVSLLAGGLIVECYILSFAKDPNNVPRSGSTSVLSWVLGLIIYLIITQMLKRDKEKKI